MALQNTIGRIYAEQLQREIEQNISLYGGDSFNLDESKLLVVPGVNHPEGLLEKMMAATNDFEAAVALYEAYPTLTPLQATQGAFWVYLAHTELFPYVQKRWPLVKKGEASKNYILDHWFFGHGLVRQTLSGLWWSIYNTIDNDNPTDKYKYSKFYLSSYTMRVVRLGTTKLVRHKEAVIGMIEYLLDTQNDSDASNSMEDRVNFVVSYFNKLGATKQLAYLDRDFFYNELSKVHDELISFKHKKSEDEIELEEIDGETISE